MKKPFYVLSESFKFNRMFPLSQKDLPEDVMMNASFDIPEEKKKIHNGKLLH